jgi:hypothetical protein
MFRRWSIEENSHRDLIRRVEKLEYMAANPSKWRVGDSIRFTQAGISFSNGVILGVEMNYSYLRETGDWVYEIFDEEVKDKKFIKEGLIDNKK